jgi:proteasome lid subunit RPN8/RPN11
MEGDVESAVGVWSVAECPFAIEYSRRVLDDIRLAVTEAFFSLPKGGAEIGGILLGKWEHDRLGVLDHAPLECEHALGPSFTLSEGDYARLAELVAARHPAGMRPVGWYHSHTRSEIFLSDADIAIHKRFFTEPWQVALVLKPHTFRPMRCGFFFREADRTIHGAATRQEFELTPLPMVRPPVGPARRPLEPPAVEPVEPEPPVPMPKLEPLRQPDAPVPVPTARAEPEVPPAPPVPPIDWRDSEQLELPYLDAIPDQEPAAPERAERPWPGRRYVFPAALLMAVVTAAFETHALWMPGFQALIRPLLPAEAAPSLGLSATEANGELHIRWDRNSPSVKDAIRGILQIRDGSPVPQEFKLDGSYLQAGIFIYARQAQRVDVELVLDEPDGRQVREAASYLGDAAAHPNPRGRLRNQLPEPGR